MFTDEQMDYFKMLGEALEERAKLLAGAAKTMGEILEQAIFYFEEISELSLLHDEPVHPAARKSFFTNILMKSQVIMRRPLSIRARSSC